MITPVQVFQEHTRNFFRSGLDSAQSPEELRLANEYFMVLKQDRAGVETGVQVVLESADPAALVLACNILMDFLTECAVGRRWNMFRTEERKSLYERIFTVISSSGPQLVLESPLAAEKLCELLGRLTRQFWSEDPEAKKVHLYALDLPAKPSFELTGCLLLRKLIEEMSPSVSRPRPQHQRNSQLFRDDFLPQVFKVGSEQLLQHIQTPEVGTGLAIAALKLLVSVLSFDASEENGVWKLVLQSNTMRKDGCWTLLEQVRTPSLIYELYCRCHQQNCSKDAPICFQFLCLFVSIQRYFYPNMSLREEILKAVISGALVIITQQIGLSADDSLLELCKLMEALATCSVHTDIHDSGLVDVFLTEVHRLTLTLLASRSSDNSVFFLMQFWARLVPSLPHLQDGSQNLKSAILRIVEEYIRACSQYLGEGDSDKELMDDAMVGVVSEMVRADTVGIGGWCLEKLRNLAEECVQGAGDLRQLQFLIKLTSSFMSENRKLTSKKLSPKDANEKRPSTTVLTYKETEVFGQLSSELFKICVLAHRSSAKREMLLACVDFLRSFQGLFLSENTNTQMQMTYAYLVQSLSLQDENGIAELWIDLVFQYLAMGCRIRNGDNSQGFDHELVSQCVFAFADLISGCKRVREAQAEYILVGACRLKPDLTSTLLTSILSKQIFLPYHPSLFSARSRLISSTAKLLFMTYKSVPGARVEDWLGSHLQVHSTSSDGCAYVSWIYEQKGIVQAITLSGDYQVWVEWFLDGPAAALLSKLRGYPGDIPLVFGVLKFLCEVSCNRVNRIMFPDHSRLGLDLAKFLINALLVYFSQTFCVQVGDQYKERYRPFCAAVTAVTHIISGRYCNISNFVSGADESFRVMFEAALKCVRGIPVEDLLSYQKQFQCVWDMVEIATQYEGLVPLIMSLSTEDLTTLLKLPNEGLQSLSNAARISSANAIINLIGFISKAPKPNVQRLVEEFRGKCEASMQELLKSVLLVVMDGYLSNNLLVSKALLGLINHQQVYYLSLKEKIIGAQSLHLQDTLRILLDDLWTNVGFTWWQLNGEPPSYSIVEENMKGAKTFGENLNKLITNYGRISWC